MELLRLARKFKELLDERFSGNYHYTPLIADILGVHEKTVHSKLRGDTQFTLLEAYKIGKRLDIPIGELFNENDDQENKHPMEIYIHDFSIMSENNTMVEQTLDAYRLATASANSKYLVASNALPDFVFFEYENIARFNYMKWLYFNRGRDNTVPLSEIVLGEADRAIQQEYRQYIKAFKRSVYILNIDMMRFIGEELLFFYKINLLSREEALTVVEDYGRVIKSLEDICNKGLELSEDRETHIFFSHLLLSHDITIIESDELNLAIMYAYFHNPVVTTGIRTFKIFRQWFVSWMHAANIISVSNPIQRMGFFEKQYNFLAGVKTKLTAL